MSRAKEVRKLRESGMSIDDICIKLGVMSRNARSEVTRVCRKAGMPMTEDEKKISKQRQAEQFAHDNDWADEYIRQKTNGKFIRVSDYIGMDSKIIIRCTECGTEKTIGFGSFRGSKRVRCSMCYQIELDERKYQREIQLVEQKRLREIERAEHKRIKACSGKQMTMVFCCDCGEVLTSKRKRCDRCQKKLNNKNKEIKRRRKIQSALVDKDITVEKLYKKDKGICYLCGCQCDYEDYIIRDGAFIAGDYYPSIDHVKPLARGRLHSWENVRLAHRICNTKKCDEWSE